MILKTSRDSIEYENDLTDETHYLDEEYDDGYDYESDEGYLKLKKRFIAKNNTSRKLSFRIIAE